MIRLRAQPRDPRTVARDIPGILDALFPQLSAGITKHLNSTAETFRWCEPADEALISASRLQHAMLFELAFAAGEQLLEKSDSFDWGNALQTATERQRRYFDAALPALLTDVDMAIAWHVGGNLARMLEELSVGSTLVAGPAIPGFRWIASGHGDFSFGSNIVEVKCIATNFGASDYRQVLMYWLLSYSASLEGRGCEWKTGILLNPRRGTIVKFNFDELITLIGSGRSKVDVLQLFDWLIGDHSARTVEH